MANTEELRLKRVVNSEKLWGSPFRGFRRYEFGNPKYQGTKVIFVKSSQALGTVMVIEQGERTLNWEEKFYST